MKYVNCNLCKANDYTVLFPKGVAQPHRVVRCNRCGLIFANPQELVDSEIADGEDHSATWEIGHIRQLIQQGDSKLHDYKKIIPKLNYLFPRRGRLLEVGSFLGVFLNQLRVDGWDVMGLEPVPAAVNYSRSKYGLEVIRGLLSNSGLADSIFDVVIMLHVIEHMPDPAKDLREIHRLLKPGGVLVVETPRYDSLMFKLLGSHERSISAKSHIYFFTTQTLCQTLEMNGFEIFDTGLVGRTLTVDRFLHNLGKISHNDQVKGWMASIGKRFYLDKIRMHLNLRDMQRVYCSK